MRFIDPSFRNVLELCPCACEVLATASHVGAGGPCHLGGRPVVPSARDERERLAADHEGGGGDRDRY